MKIGLRKVYISKILPSQNQDVTPIIEAFNRLNEFYKYFPKDSFEAQQSYIRCYRTIREVITHEAEAATQEYVYNMMLLFSPEDGYDVVSILKNFEKYSNTYINDSNQLNFLLIQSDFNDIPQFPVNDSYATFDYDLSDIKNTLKTNAGPKVLKYSRMWRQLQNKNGGTLPKHPKEFEAKVLELLYPGREENPAIYDLCIANKLTILQIQYIIDLLKSDVLPSDKGEKGLRLKGKTEDNLPNVTIPYVNHETGTNYYLIKLPSDNLRACVLGALTGNCQSLGSLGGDANVFIIDGITRPNNGFYVIIKESAKKILDTNNIDWENFEQNGHEIVGQSYAWIGRGGKSITFEAPQVIKDRCHNIDIMEIFENFGKAIEKLGFNRFTIGRHTNGLSGCKNFKTLQSTQFGEIPTEGEKYHFSRGEQYEIYISEELQDMRQTFAEITKFLPGISPHSSNHIISLEQGRAVIELLSPPINENDARNFKSLFGLQQSINMFISPYLTANWTVENLERLHSKIPIIIKNHSSKLGPLYSSVLLNLGATEEDLLSLSDSAVELVTRCDFNSTMTLARLVPMEILINRISNASSTVDIMREVLKLAVNYRTPSQTAALCVDNLREEIVLLLAKKISDCDFLKNILEIPKFESLPVRLVDLIVCNQDVLKVLAYNSRLPLKKIFTTDFYESAKNCLFLFFKAQKDSGFSYLDDEEIQHLPDFALDILFSCGITLSFAQFASITKKFRENESLYEEKLKELLAEESEDMGVNSFIPNISIEDLADFYEGDIREIRAELYEAKLLANTEFEF